MIGNSGAIPDWDSSGHLPPFESRSTGPRRSPYATGLVALALRLGTTARRQELLNGLLDLRASFRSAGLREGFQWVDGSFVDDPGHRTEEPKDIDVVTFFHLPPGETQQSFSTKNSPIFDASANKIRYGVHSYFVVLDPNNIAYMIDRTCYWNSFWSHDRESQWKGYLEIPLSSGDDEEAKAVLSNAAFPEVRQ